MRVVPGRQERLDDLFVVVGSTILFAPAIWLLQRWGARWLGEHLTAHPYLTAGVVFSIVLSSGMVMLILVSLANRLAARLAGRRQQSASGSREEP
jgi:divalent metal cation (Fe/Co/Zn/Cd) transporter